MIKVYEDEMLAAFYLTRSHEGSKARSFLFHAKLAREQRRKEIRNKKLKIRNKEMQH